MASLSFHAPWFGFSTLFPSTSLFSLCISHLHLTHTFRQDYFIKSRSIFFTNFTAFLSSTSLPFLPPLEQYILAFLYLFHTTLLPVSRYRTTSSSFYNPLPIFLPGLSNCFKTPALLPCLHHMSFLYCYYFSMLLLNTSTPLFIFFLILKCNHFWFARVQKQLFSLCVIFLFRHRCQIVGMRQDCKFSASIKYDSTIFRNVSKNYLPIKKLIAEE